jgi:ferric-dicitrate binding protein FerR (iron transport regulator)
MPHTPTLLRGWLSGALSTIAVIALGIFVVRAVPSRPAHTVATHATYATSTGQLATVTLRDGSRITLAPRTTVTVSSDFGTRDRTVTLVGQAHFDVQPNPDLPFVVHTGAVITRVLGTTFDLRHYADDSVGRIVVFSGKVASGARTGSMTLTAGRAGRFTDSAVTGATANDSTIYTDWGQGRLVFRDAPVNVILTALRQWYGYEFRLTDSTLASRHYSAVFLAGDADEMFKVVSHMLGGVSMTWQDSVIILRPNHNVMAPARDTRRPHTPFHAPTEVGR